MFVYQITTRHHNSHSLTLSPHQHQRLSKPQCPKEFIVWARYVFIIDCMFLINLYYLVFVYDTMDHHHIRRHVTEERRATRTPPQYTTQGAEGFVRSRGAQTSRLGPGMFFFSSFFLSFLLTFIILRVIRPADPPSLQERVGGPFLHIIRPTDPPSLQERVGGPLLPLFYTNGPTLATNASRWAVFTRSDPTLAPNASRWSLSHPYGPPSLQTRVGGPFSLS